MELPELLKDKLIDVFALVPEQQEQALRHLYAQNPGYQANIQDWLQQEDLNFEAAPELDGPYEVLEMLGQGAFGKVFLAEQLEPVRRRVAVKVLQAGIGSKEVLQRFQTEQQTLAILDHPFIAKVFDAGETRGGLPYFVMEWVQGEPIHRFCDHHRLSIKQRLHLFMDVCGAVHHAHQKGIIHRDLKPSNILVAHQDDRLLPKVIDFGIAKAAHQPIAERSMTTHQGQLLGTLEYMGPEQASSPSWDVDIRADVYSLGVLLYELLTGTLPVPSKRFSNAGLQEILLLLQETEVEAPSLRLRNLRDEENSNSAGELSYSQIQFLRSAEKEDLCQRAQGDLDWILLRALQKDRDMRYESASAFALDIRKHLDNEVISAHPPSFRYRLQKFVKKHRLSLAAASVAITGILVGLVMALAGYFQATRSLGESQGKSLFYQKWFTQADPSRQMEFANAHGEFLSDAREVFAKEPLTLAALYSNRAAFLLTMGNFEHAKDLYHKSLDLHASPGRQQSLAVAQLNQKLGELELNMGNLIEAEKHISVSLDICNMLQPSPAVEVVRALSEAKKSVLTWVYYQDLDQAEALLHRASGRFESSLGQSNMLFAVTLNDLARLFFMQGETQSAMTFWEAAIETAQRMYGAQNPLVGANLLNYANWLFENDFSEKAEAYALQALRNFPPDIEAFEFQRAKALEILAQLNWEAGRFSLARDYEMEILQIYQRSLGKSHLATQKQQLRTAQWVWRKSVDHESARELLAELLQVQAEAQQPDNLVAETRTLWTEIAVATADDGEGKRAIVEEYAEFVAELFGEKPRERAHYLRTAATLAYQAGELQRSRDMGQAAQLAREELLRGLYDERDASAAVEYFLAKVDHRKGFFGAAAERLQRVVAGQEQRFGLRDLRVIHAKQAWLQALNEAGQTEEAQKIFGELSDLTQTTWAEYHEQNVLMRVLQTELGIWTAQELKSWLVQRPQEWGALSRPCVIRLQSVLPGYSYAKLKNPFNLGFERGSMDAFPVGWHLPEASRELGALVWTTAEQAFMGERSLKLQFYDGAENLPSGVSGNVLQSFSAEQFRDQLLHLRLALKVQALNETAHARIWMRVDTPASLKAGDLAPDVYSTKIFAQDWRGEELTIQVPDNAENIAFGVLFTPGVSAWVDNFTLQSQSLGQSWQNLNPPQK